MQQYHADLLSIKFSEALNLVKNSRLRETRRTIYWQLGSILRYDVDISWLSIIVIWRELDCHGRIMQQYHADRSSIKFSEASNLVKNSLLRGTRPTIYWQLGSILRNVIDIWQLSIIIILRELDCHDPIMQQCHADRSSIKFSEASNFVNIHAYAERVVRYTDSSAV